MANPSGSHSQDPNHPSSFNGVAAAPNNGCSGPESSPTVLKHNPGISTDWSVEEQAILEDGLNKYGAESSIIRYAKIAMLLQNKTVRDVALRCRWMTERVADPSAKTSQFMGQSNVPSYGSPMMPFEYDDGISYKAIGGVTGELFEQTAQVFQKISTNMATMKVLGKNQPLFYESNPLIKENHSLLAQARDNILRVVNEMNDMPDIMKQMPTLPVKLNEELANAFLGPPNLPSSNHPIQ